MKATHKINYEEKQYLIKSRKISKKKLRKQRQSSWSVVEQIAYVQFLKENSSLMKTTESRKKHKVFKILSEIIGTRSSIQAKSHHQKLQQKYNSTYNIILNIGNTIKSRMLELQRATKTYHIESLANSRFPKLSDCPLQIEEIEERSPKTFQDQFFEDNSQNYDAISACIAFDENQPLI